MPDNGSPEKPVPGSEGTGSKENQIDRAFKELNSKYFREHSQMFSESTDPEDQARLIAVQEMKSSLDQLSDPRKMEFIGRENMQAEVALGLGEVYRLMASNRLPLEGATPEHAQLREARHQQSRELFLAAGKKLWPKDSGSDSGLNFALQRLEGAKLADFIPAGALDAKAIRDRGVYIDGRPPSPQQEQLIIDKSMLGTGMMIGSKVWEIADSETMTGMQKVGQEKLLGETLKQVYVIERYRDSLTPQAAATPSAKAQ